MWKIVGMDEKIVIHEKFEVGKLEWGTVEKISTKLKKILIGKSM